MAHFCSGSCSAPAPDLPFSHHSPPTFGRHFLLFLCVFVLVLLPFLALSDPEAVAGFSELFWSSKLAHISSLDFCALSAVIVDPIREDMRRRGVEPELAKVALFSVPLVGPALWMLVRPPVES